MAHSQHLVAVMGVGVVPADHAVITADDLGLTRGDGVFDGLRVVRDADGVRVDHLDRHLERFARSCAANELPAPDLDAWRALVAEATAAWTVPGESMMKVIATRGREFAPGAPTQFLTIAPLETGSCVPLRVATLTRGYTSDAFADAPWLLGQVKSLSYAVNMAALREAARRDADEVLFTSADGYCLEGPKSGVIAAFGDEYVTTPTGATGILDSVTIAVVAEGLRARGVRFTERLYTPAELARADAAWVLSAVRGVCDIVALDGAPMASDPARSALLRGLAGF